MTSLVKTKGIEKSDPAQELDLGNKSIKEQMMVVYEELSKAIQVNKAVEKSLYGVFHKNF